MQGGMYRCKTRDLEKTEFWMSYVSMQKRGCIDASMLNLKDEPMHVIDESIHAEGKLILPVTKPCYESIHDEGESIHTD